MRPLAPLAALLLALAACTASWDPAMMEGNIISPGNFKAGSGVITQVGVIPNANQGGGDKKPRDPNLYRLYLQMDKTGTQFVDVDSATFMQGEAVELTNDGRVVRITGTSMNDALRR